MIAKPGKIVLATNGTHGDVHPFIAIALELKAMGYAPVVATSERYRDKVVAEDIAFHAVRPDERKQLDDLGIDVLELTRRMMEPGAAGIEFVIRRLLLPHLKESYADLLSATEHAAAVVTSSFAFAATLVAEKRGLPYVNLVLQPSMFFSTEDPPSALTFPGLTAWCPPLARALRQRILAHIDRRIHRWAGPIQALRAELGLPPAACNPLLAGQRSPYATVGLYSRALVTPVGALISHAHTVFGGTPKVAEDIEVVGFALYDSESGGPPRLPLLVEQFLASGPRPIVFALGSQAVHVGGDFYRAGLDTASRLGRRALLLVGPDGRQALPEQLPEGVCVTEYAPYSLVFPRASAIVHHGGIGTTGQALRSGRPQLIVPFWGDQYDNAARVVRIGAGRTIARARSTPARLTSELERLHIEPSYAREAAAVAAIVAQENGAREAARIISEWVHQRRGESTCAQSSSPASRAASAAESPKCSWGVACTSSVASGAPRMPRGWL